MGCHFLLQWIFQTQGLNPHLLHGQADSLPMHHLGSPGGSMLANKYTQRTSPILCLSHSLLTIFTHIFKMSTTSSRNIILRQKKKGGCIIFTYFFFIEKEKLFRHPFLLHISSPVPIGQHCTTCTRPSWERMDQGFSASRGT